MDYKINWSAEYADLHLIQSSGWSVDPVEDGGLIVAAMSHDGREAAVTIMGGKVGHSYALTNAVTQSNGETDERSLSFRIEER